MRRLCRNSRTICAVSLGCLIALGTCDMARAQRAGPAYPPTAARSTVSADAPLVESPSPIQQLATLVRTGRVQIVRFETPAGADVEIASSNGVSRVTIPAQVGLVVGQTYRLRVSNIPEKSGLTVYPTIRLIGFIMPPAHVNPLEFPVPLHFLPRDFDEAAEGRLVTSATYLEDPTLAIPQAFPPGELPVVDLGPGDDVLEHASAMGRPIVLMQLGNRVPLDGQFDNGHSAPPVFFAPAGGPVSGIDASKAAHHSAVTRPLPGAQTVGWQQAAAPLAWSAAAMHGKPSVPACAHTPPVIRLPYRSHPRMPLDEYLCDGGDRVPYAHFSGQARAAEMQSTDMVGLGPAETMAQFSRPGEKPRLVTSNEVCVYAPRFAVMRASSSSVGGLQIEGPRGVGQTVRRGAMESRTAADQRTQRLPPKAVRARERPGSVAMTDIPTGMDEIRVIVGVHQHEAFAQFAGRIGPNEAGQAEDPRIARCLDAATAWNRVQYPAYTAITEGGGQISGYLQTGEIQQVREPDRKPGELALWKVALPAAAKQGDVVEFAIFYRNSGEKPIESVSIIDSLTARLEYVADSAKSDRPAVFTAAANDVESHELRWDLRDPIPGGQGGTVWFKAKVR